MLRIKEIKHQRRNNTCIIKKLQPNFNVKFSVRKSNGNLKKKYIGIRYPKSKLVQQECKNKPSSSEECGMRKRNITNKSKEDSK